MRFRKKPVEINAWQYVGEPVKGVCNSAGCYSSGNTKHHVHTAHGGQLVNLEVGDWIIPESDGEHFYPCKASVFAATYDPVEHG